MSPTPRSHRCRDLHMSLTRISSETGRCQLEN
jgi:hypothetical protein